MGAVFQGLCGTRCVFPRLWTQVASFDQLSTGSDFDNALLSRAAMGGQGSYSTLESTILSATFRVASSGNTLGLLESRLRLALPWKLDDVVRTWLVQPYRVVISPLSASCCRSSTSCEMR